MSKHSLFAGIGIALIALILLIALSVRIDANNKESRRHITPTIVMIDGYSYYYTRTAMAPTPATLKRCIIEAKDCDE